MGIDRIIYLIFVAGYVFYLPGYLMTRIFFPERDDAIMTFALSLGLSITLIPVLSFSVAMFFHTIISEGLVLGVVTVVNLICLLNDPAIKAKVKAKLLKS